MAQQQRARAQDAPDGAAQPWDLAAEQAVLGCAMWKPDALAVAVGIIGPRDFFKPGHEQVWEALLELAERDEPTDLVALTDALRRKGELGLVGGWEYLHTIYAAPVTPSSVDHYAKIVARHARQRRVIAAATRLAQAGWAEDPDDMREMVARVRADLDEEVSAVDHAPTSWLPVDLGGVVMSDLAEPPPELLRRADGACLLYPGKVHALAGESESGKTWVALLAAAQVILGGQDVLVVDFEDSVSGIVGRLLAMGIPTELVAARLIYVRPDEALTARGRAALHPVLEERDVRLAVVDGVTEAMVTHGLDPDKNSDAAAFYALLPRWLARMGPAVVLIDHVNKDPDTRGRWAIGAQHKLAGLDGAQYTVELRRPFGVGREGTAILKVAKDRPGRVRENASDGGWMGVLRLVSDHAGRVEARLDPPRSDGDAGEIGFKPTYLMERISRYVEANPGMSTRAIEAALKGRAQDMRLAIELLIGGGYVRVTKSGQAHRHFHVKPFRDGDELGWQGKPPPAGDPELPPEPDPDDAWYRGRY